VVEQHQNVDNGRARYDGLRLLSCITIALQDTRPRRPTSFRLPEELLSRLEAESRAADVSVTRLVTDLLEEGLKLRRFPGVVYRSGPAGRRAGLVGGPDVWEVIRDLRSAPREGMERARFLADEVELPVASVLLAADFYAAHPDEIDHLIEANERAAEEIRAQLDRRERLLAR